jgi:CDP-glucose 4,6-dehydratase
MAKWEGTLEAMGLDSKFWNGKNVFITGHTGFKGSWLSLWLNAMGANVTGYALPPPTNPSLFETLKLESFMKSVIGDVRNLENLKNSLDESQAEIVFHMAAQSLVRPSFENPVDTYSTNLMGTVNLLESVRHSKSVRSLVIVTTDKCYENREWEWGYRENEAMGGYDPYSNSKGCAELATASFRSSFFNTNKYEDHKVGIASARAGNVIGGGDWAVDRLIPDLIQAFSNNQVLLIRSPNATRPWQHVLEPLRGYLTLAKKLFTNGNQFSESWNFGPYDVDVKPVSWIVDYLGGLWPDNPKWQIDKNLHPHEANYLKLDISKARNKLDWEPRLNLETSLGLIVDWYKALKNKEDMHQFTLMQIEQYTKLNCDSK